jgi:hypothetical protein
MRKSFITLTGILVCALTAMGAVSKPQVSGLSASELNARIAEARSALQQQPVSRDLVRLAALDGTNGQMVIIPLSKSQFLTKDADLIATASSGKTMQVHVVRANGVNTAVSISNAAGQALVPLMVQFPIVRDGAVTEVGYYTSAHPALLSTELSSAGQNYVRTMLNEAATRLASQGIAIPEDIVDIAEHLCIVEHTDHRRYMTEDESELFPEIQALYALNQGNTYRYSVSSAGAGGMIQMIPRTYEGIRQQHTDVSLNTDFVNGMRDHANALEAMLLYMNDTWNGLAVNPEVQTAMNAGLASKPELMAAGYNSNPMRLAGYLKNGGAQWRTLIPAETQMYLRIYASVDQHLEADQSAKVAGSSAKRSLAMGVSESLPLLAWLRGSLTTSAFSWLH